jgi:hypothetical protein
LSNQKSWSYNKKKFLNDNIPEGAFGFIYAIKLEVDGVHKRYIGKKQFFSTRTVAKGKKELAAMTDKRGSKKKKVIKPDFENYFSSNKQIKELAQKGIPIKRVILRICYSKMELTYQEMRYQFKLDVLEKDEYLNDNINGKFYKSKIQNDVRNKKTTSIPNG